MPQIFHRSTNTLSRVTIFGAIFFIAAFLWLLAALTRSSYATRKGVALTQPVMFSHDHHVGAIGIDCRYCHTSVETSPVAGIPPTSTCMNCHAQIWNRSPVLEPVRASFRDNRPLQWTRVHDLPDFVYFDHSIHVHKGIGCVTCHGRVDRMPLTWRASSLQMEWCLECHRHPERYVRPVSEVFNMKWERPAGDPHLGERLVAEYGIHKRLTDCSICHH
jgi:hypothetical protein